MEDKLKNLTIGKALLIGLALAGIYWYSMYDDGVAKENAIVALDGELAQKDKEIASINKAIEDAERFQQKMSVLGEEMERVLRAMPVKLTGLDLMRIISNEAKGVGAEINQLNSPQGFRQEDPNAPVKFYEDVPIDVDITGTYNQVMLFLSNLTRLDKIITTAQLALRLGQSTGPGASASSPKINMKASFLAYRYLANTKKEEVK